jgi:hypothetical protein
VKSLTLDRHTDSAEESAGRNALIVPEIFDARWSGKSSGCWWQLLIRRLLQPVLDEQTQIVALIENLAFDLRVELAQAAHLPILLGHQLLAHRGDLDVEIVIGEVEVGAKELRRGTVGSELDCKLARLVLPVDLVEIEESRKLSFAFVSKIDLFCLGQLFGVVLTQLARASVTSSETAVPSPGNKR